MSVSTVTRYLGDSDIEDGDLDLHAAVRGFDKHHMLGPQRAVDEVAAKNIEK